MKNNRHGLYSISKNGIHYPALSVFLKLHERGVLKTGGVACRYRIATTEENKVYLCDEDMKPGRHDNLSDWMHVDHALFEAYTKSFENA